MGTRRLDRSALVVWGLLVPLGLILRIHRLGERSLWVDEAASVALARLGWVDFARALWGFEANMSLYYVLLRAWRLLGEGEAQLRLLSVLLGVLSIAAVFTVGRRLQGPLAGVAAAALLAVNPLHIRYSQEARSYALLMLLAIVSTDLFVRCIRGGSRVCWILYTITVACAVYSHFFGIWLVPAHLASLVVLDRTRVPWKSIVASMFGLVLLLLPAASFVLTRESGQLDWIREPRASVVVDLFLRMGGYSRLLLLPLLVLAAAALVAGLGFLPSRDGSPPDRWRTLVPLTWLVVPIAGTWLFSLWRPALYPRFLLLCLPAFLLMAGQGLARLTARPRGSAVAAIMAIILLSTFSLRAAATADRARSRDGHEWRSCTRFVLERGAPGEGLLFFTPLGRLSYEYYAGSPAPATGPAILFPRHGEPRIHEDFGVPSPEMVRSLILDRSRLWLILSDAWLPGTEESRPGLHAIQRAMDGSFTLEEERTFPGDGRIVVRSYRRL